MTAECDNANNKPNISVYQGIRELIEQFDAMPGFEMTAAKLSLALDQCKVDVRAIEQSKHSGEQPTLQ